MVEIVKSNKLIDSLLNYNTEEDMVLSNYTIFYKKDNGYLLYNTLTRNLLFCKGNSLDSIIADNRQYLCNKHFLIPSSINEHKIAQQVKNFISNIKCEKGINAFSIFTTSDCNARCFYCFEYGHKKISMSQSTAKDVVSFILKNCNKDKIDLAWFGGEPLYNSEVIDTITNLLKENGKTISSTMISNGLYFTEKNIKKAVNDWNLKVVQITLDGTEDKYNRVKNYIDEVDSPYKIVMNNIGNLLKSGIGVQIRVNIGKHNASDIYDLAKEIFERFPNERKLDIYSFPLYENRGIVEKNRTEYERNQIIQQWMDFEQYIYEIGIGKTRRLDNLYSNSYCMACNDNNITIYPDGSLGKCDHAMDKEKLGDINSGIVNHELIDYWKTQRAEISECQNCTSYPICNRIEHCPEEQNICDDAERIFREYRIIQGMVSSYDYAKKENIIL